MAELARAADVHRARGARVLRPALDLARGGAVGHHLDRAAVRSATKSEPSRSRHPTPGASRCARASSSEQSCAARTRRGRARAAPLDELDAVRLVVAGEQRAPAVARALDEPELQRTSAPRPRRDRRRADRRGRAGAAITRRPSATMRSASSSGIASATWSVWPRPAAARRGRRGRRPTPRSCS